jgi:cytochrome c peroxidase
MKSLLVSCAVLIILFSCKKEGELNTDVVVNNSHTPKLNLPDSVYQYGNVSFDEIMVDETLKVQDNMPENNPITPWGATLGRVLFYDKNLSKNNTISCGSCHVQANGFSDTEVLSKGFEGGLTDRHSMALVNARYYFPGSFFWDTRARSLEDQVLMPIQDPVEMGLTLDLLVERVKNQSYYPELFEKAFDSTEVTSGRIAKALAQFVRSIVSVDAKFDVGLSIHKDPKVPFQNFTPEENLGKNIFFGSKTINCSGCHFTIGFITDVPRNNGVRDNDFGAFIVNRDQRMIGAFKTPSLKNIAVRPPYMHNGSLASLIDVVEHYNSQLTNEDNHLDPHLRNGEEPIKMNLTDGEKNALVSFLHTLTDEELLASDAFSDPFE